MVDSPSTSKEMEESEPSPGPVNIRQVEEYTQTLEVLFNRVTDLIKEDRRDALEVTMGVVKNHMAKTWPNMTTTDMSITLLTITDPSCSALHESLESHAITLSDPEEEIPTRHQVLRRLPQQQTRVVTEHCITLFDNLSAATHHISLVMANLSSLAKLVITDTFMMILRAITCPLVQQNIAESMLDPTRDKPVPSDKEIHKE